MRGRRNNTADGTRRVQDRISVVDPGAPKDIGSRAHLIRLQAYARTRLNRSNITLKFSGICGCGHPEDKHKNKEACSGANCTCQKYTANGSGSYTDMKGNITVQADLPANGKPEERELCIRGLLRHEICHEYRTNPDVHRKFVKELQKMGQNKQEITAQQLQKIWNILEDGMIEERERDEKPDAYQYISALNRLWPRVGQTSTFEKEVVIGAPDNYVPRDADGKKLKVITVDGKKKVVIPAGTKISPWGKYPLNTKDQMISALLAESVPEFEPGQLHPDVDRVLKECQPHIDAALSGNTADCVQRAYAIHAILRKNDLIRGDLTDEEREELQQLAEQLQEMMANAPDMDPNGEGDPNESGKDQGGSGGGQMPVNGTPSEGGQESMSQELQDSMNGQGDSSDDEGQEGGGGAGKDDEEGEDEGKEKGSGDKDGEEGEDEEEGKKGGKMGNNNQDSRREGQKGDDSSGQGTPGKFGDQKSSPNGPGANDQGQGLKNNELPKSVRNENAKNGKGSVSKDELNKMLNKAKDDLQTDKSNQRRSDMANIRQNKLEGNSWKLPGNSSVTTQKELASGSHNHRSRYGHNPLEDEQGELKKLGTVLGSHLKRIKSRARAPERFQKRGKMDSRRLGPAVGGSPKVFKKKGKNLNIDMEIDINIDRSGSVTGSPLDNTNQYRMAKMFAVASKETRIPMTIYGWDGGYGSCSHYAYKERHSEDMRGVDALLNTGGGGTPTAEGIEFSRARLKKSDAGQKIMLCITDGAANDPESARAQVEAAQRQGVKVLGMSFSQGGYDSSHYMDQQFGPGNWISIENYTDAPRILSDIIRKAATSAAQK